MFVNIFLSALCTVLLGKFNAKLWEMIFSNRQFGMRVYIRIVMIAALE